MSTLKKKPPMRIISTAWGASYVLDFLNLCLPAVLAPGNLPALAEHFSVEFIFVTEKSMFDYVNEHHACKYAKNFCDFRCVEVDDLVTERGSYGMSLTHALYRGLEDLGPAMVDYYFIFVNSDFILADGSYRGILPYLLAGKRLIFSPSYCTITEEVSPQLEAAKTENGAVLAVPPRKMAELILNHRHLTIRAKTINQPYFHPDYMDQYYWSIDANTLLVRQFPVALVAMKPEKYLAEPGSYWDYGIIADFCPSMEITPISDSDEYLMLELRERHNAKGRLTIGKMPNKNIAERLFTLLTDYVTQFAHIPFVLHSQDLPDQVSDASLRLDEFVEKILQLLPAAAPSRHNHPQWVHHYDRFMKARHEFLMKQANKANALENIGTEESEHPAAETQEEKDPDNKEEINSDTSEHEFTSQIKVLGTYIQSTSTSNAPPTVTTIGATAAFFLDWINTAIFFESTYQTYLATLAGDDPDTPPALHDGDIARIRNAAANCDMAEYRLMTLLSQLPDRRLKHQKDLICALKILSGEDKKSLSPYRNLDNVGFYSFLSEDGASSIKALQDAAGDATQQIVSFDQDIKGYNPFDPLWRDRLPHIGHVATMFMEAGKRFAQGLDAEYARMADEIGQLQELNQLAEQQLTQPEIADMIADFLALAQEGHQILSETFAPSIAEMIRLLNLVESFERDKAETESKIKQEKNIHYALIHLDEKHREILSSFYLLQTKIAESNHTAQIRQQTIISDAVTQMRALMASVKTAPRPDVSITMPISVVKQPKGWRTFARLASVKMRGVMRWKWCLGTASHASQMVATHARSAKNILYVSDGAPLLLPQLARYEFSVISLDILLHIGPQIVNLVQDGQRFDLCVIDVEFARLGSFRSIHTILGEVMTNGGTIVALFSQSTPAKIDPHNISFIDGAFPSRCGTARVVWSGMDATVTACRWRESSANWLRRRLKMPAQASLIFGTLITLPLALKASMKMTNLKTDDGGTPYENPVSVAIEITT